MISIPSWKFDRRNVRTSLLYNYEPSHDCKVVQNISPVLAELVRKMSEMKNEYEGNDWLLEIDIPLRKICCQNTHFGE